MMGVNYYRLKQVDFDGSFSYSDAIAIDVEERADKHIFYPNPTSGELNYQFYTLHNQNITVEIVDMLGKSLSLRAYPVNVISLDLEDYAAGTYVVRVMAEDQSLLTIQKIVKRRL